MGAETQAKPPPDWERIEADYRAGVLSLREIALPYKVSHVAIKKRAEKEGWTRDLRARIDARAEELVNRQAVTSEVNAGRAVNDKLVVEANAQQIAAIKTEHRANSARARDLSLKLLRELEVETDNADLFEKLGELMFGPDDKGVDKLNEAYRKAISFPSRVSSMKALSESLRICITMERESYGIDNKAPLGDANVTGGVTYTANIPKRGA